MCDYVRSRKGKLGSIVVQGWYGVSFSECVAWVSALSASVGERELTRNAFFTDVLTPKYLPLAKLRFCTHTAPIGALLQNSLKFRHQFFLLRGSHLFLSFISPPIQLRSAWR